MAASSDGGFGILGRDGADEGRGDGGRGARQLRRSRTDGDAPDSARVAANLEQLTLDPASHMEQDMGIPLPEQRQAEARAVGSAERGVRREGPMEGDSSGGTASRRVRGRFVGPLWRCSIQPSHIRARCQECQHGFKHGDVRICSARARVHPRYWHVACVTSPLGAPDNIEGLRDLTAEQQQVVAPFLDMHVSIIYLEPPPPPKTGSISHVVAFTRENHDSHSVFYIFKNLIYESIAIAEH